MTNSLQLRRKRAALIERAEAIVNGAVSQVRALQGTERAEVDSLLAQVRELDAPIAEAIGAEDRERNAPPAPGWR